MDRDTTSIFVTDERAVAPVIGFILLFAIGIIAFSSYQAVVVPNQNAEVEFSHSQQIENEFSEFHSNVVNAIEGNDERSTSFTLGTQYPSRLIALNPPPPAGTLLTTEPGTVELGGATVSNVCGGDTSRSLMYEPQYNEYQSAQSTVYEHSFVGTTFRNGQAFPQSQRLIQDDRVNLRLLTGDVSESRIGSFSVEINATHRYTHDQNITSLTIPSQFDNETWETQILDDQANVDNVENTPDGVRIEFIDSVEVSCAVVGVNHDPAFAPPAETATETVGGNASVFDTQWNENSLVEVKPEESVTLTMEATERGVTPRSPIENTTVDFAEEGDGGADIFDSINPQGDVTDSNGNQDLALEIASGTIENQSRIYTTAGDDSDVLTLSVVGYKVDIESTNSPVTEGEPLEITATIENIGSVSETQPVELEIEGVGVVDSESVTLDGGSSESVTFTWQTASGDAGDYTATVSSEDDSDSTDVTVDPAPDLGPTFESVEATVTDENTGGNPGIEQITFDWQLSDTTDIELRIYDGDGNTIGSEDVTLASIDGTQPVDVTEGSRPGGNREPRPVVVEATITDTGETCSGTIESGDGDGPFELCN